MDGEWTVIRVSNPTLYRPNRQDDDGQGSSAVLFAVLWIIRHCLMLTNSPLFPISLSTCIHLINCNCSNILLVIKHHLCLLGWILTSLSNNVLVRITYKHLLIIHPYNIDMWTIFLLLFIKYFYTFSSHCYHEGHCTLNTWLM